jgi:hypothetical protein
MASREAIAIRQNEALREIRDVLEKHDPEAEGRLRKAADSESGSLPNSYKRPEEFAAYLAESVASLARLVDRQLTPRRRGRPPKPAQ